MKRTRSVCPFCGCGCSFYILSEGGGKFANLSRNPKVAYSIASRINGGRGLMRVRGLQVWGRAEVVSMHKHRKRFEEILQFTGIMASLGERGMKGLPSFHYRFIVVEPEKADCHYQSARAGKPTGITP